MFENFLSTPRGYRIDIPGHRHRSTQNLNICLNSHAAACHHVFTGNGILEVLVALYYFRLSHNTRKLMHAFVAAGYLVAPCSDKHKGVWYYIKQRWTNWNNQLSVHQVPCSFLRSRWRLDAESQPMGRQELL